MSFKDDFELIMNDECHEIICHSYSGNDYTIKFVDGVITCDCRGFEYRKNCRHIDEARDEGLISTLATTPVKNCKKDNYCRNCGNAFNDKDNYCGQCGNKRS